jgi:hypothetical protein
MSTNPRGGRMAETRGGLGVPVEGERGTTPESVGCETACAEAARGPK